MTRGTNNALALLSLVFVTAIIRNGAKKGTRTSRKGKAQLAAAAAAAEGTAAAVSSQAECVAPKDVKSYYISMTTVIVDADFEEDVVECTTAELKGAPDTPKAQPSSSWWQDLLHMLSTALSTVMDSSIEFFVVGLLCIVVGLPMVLLGAVVLGPAWLWNSIKALAVRLCMDSQSVTPLGSDALHESIELTCSKV